MVQIQEQTMWSMSWQKKMCLQPSSSTGRCPKFLIHFLEDSPAEQLLYMVGKYCCDVRNEEDFVGKQITE